MLKLDNNLLDELGLGSLPEDQKRAMLQHIYETLELRVGTNLANQMTDQQLEEFEKFIDEGGDANQSQALQWLESNLPNYKQVVNDVFEALKGEIKQMAPQLVASSTAQVQQAAASNPATMSQGQPMGPQPTDVPAGYQPPTDPAAYAAPQPAYQYQSPTPQAQPLQPYAPTPQPMQQPYPPLATTGVDDNSSQQQPPAGPGAGQPPQYPDQQAV